MEEVAGGSDGNPTELRELRRYKTVILQQSVLLSKIAKLR